MPMDLVKQTQIVHEIVIDPDKMEKIITHYFRQKKIVPDHSFLTINNEGLEKLLPTVVKIIVNDSEKITLDL
jgi:hypothetical protein